MDILYFNSHCIFCDRKFGSTMHTNSINKIVDTNNNVVKNIVRCDSCFNYMHKKHCSKTYESNTKFYSLPQYNFPKAILCQGCEQDEEVLYPNGKALYEMESNNV